MRVTSGWIRRLAAATAGAALALQGACSPGSDPSGPNASTVALESVSPASGATGVAITMPMRMRFTGPVGGAMERYVALHEGALTGPVVAGAWLWSADGRTLTFTPDAPLAAHTTYVVHMGGGMHAADGSALDYASCAELGGHPVNAGMMGGGSGMMGAEMTSPGWRGSDGGYGMIFTFTTA